jgi:hypothetical protein
MSVDRDKNLATWRLGDLTSVRLACLDLVLLTPALVLSAGPLRRILNIYIPLPAACTTGRIVDSGRLHDSRGASEMNAERGALPPRCDQGGGGLSPVTLHPAHDDAPGRLTPCGADYPGCDPHVKAA